MDCVFCKILSGDIPAKTLKETSMSVALLDAFPLAKGHVLVIPKNHYEKMQQIPPEENTELFETVRRVLSKVDTLTNATLVALHNGKDSGQEVPHVHIHLIPRSKEDSAGAVHSMFKDRPKPSDEEFNKLVEKLKS